MADDKKRHLIFLIFVLGVAIVLCLLFRNIPILNSTLFATTTVLILPALLLFLLERKNTKKIILGTLIFGPLFGLILEFMAELNQDWMVGQLITGIKILNFLPLENIIGHFAMAFLIFTFYEHFLSETKTREISKKILLPTILALIVNIFIFTIYFINKELLIFNYSYLIMGIIAIIPLVIIVLKNPKLLNKLLHLVLFFAPLFFVLEIIGVYNGYWSFPGENYVGIVYIGDLKFAFEDFILWTIFYPPAIVSYYEYSLNKKNK